MDMLEYNHFCHCRAPNSNGENEMVKRTPDGSTCLTKKFVNLHHFKEKLDALYLISNDI
jgi:hypothetical protein